MVKSLSKEMRKIPIMWGGVFATFAPHLILRDNVELEINLLLEKGSF